MKKRCKEPGCKEAIYSGIRVYCPPCSAKRDQLKDRPQTLRRWRDLALEMADYLDDGDMESAVELAAQARALSAKPEASSRPGRRRRTSPVPGPGKVRSRGGDYTTCSGCSRKVGTGRGQVRSLAGAYCPTCRQRGAQCGWCGCGGALYPDGRCGNVSRHARIRKAAREAAKARAS